MNRTRDLENLEVLYENNIEKVEGPLLNKPVYGNPTYYQNITIKKLSKYGFTISKTRTNIDQDGNIVLVKHSPKTKEEAETFYYVDPNGKVNGEDVKVFLADQEEDELGIVENPIDTSTVGVPKTGEFTQEAEDQNPLENDESEESDFKVGDSVRFLLGDEFRSGEIIHIQNDIAFVDCYTGVLPVPVEDLKRSEENNEDPGPNQQDEGWGDEAMNGNLQ